MCSPIRFTRPGARDRCVGGAPKISSKAAVRSLLASSLRDLLQHLYPSTRGRSSRFWAVRASDHAIISKKSGSSCAESLRVMIASPARASVISRAGAISRGRGQHQRGEYRGMKNPHPSSSYVGTRRRPGHRSRRRGPNGEPVSTTGHYVRKYSSRGHWAQRPRVKSGTSIGRLRFATDHSVSGTMADIIAAS